MLQFAELTWRSSAMSVPFPTPDGPQITSGCGSARSAKGVASSDAAASPLTASTATHCWRARGARDGRRARPS